MTKKSDARKARDKQTQAIKDDNLEPPYKTLNRLHSDHVQLLVGYHELGTKAISPEVLPHLTDINATNRVMKLMASDVKKVTAQGNELYNGFKDKPIDTPMEKLTEDEHFNCVMTVQKYADIATIHDLDILPNVNELREHIIAAVDRRKATEPAPAPTEAAPEAAPANPTADVQG
jgi:hypothetical protein